MSKKILIVNLKRAGDIFSMGHTINGIKATDSTRVSVVVFGEFKTTTEILKGIEKTYCIDRKQIQTIFKNRIYNDAFALDQFHEQIAPILTEKWDQIVNYSNDLASTNLSNFIAAHTGGEVIGVSFNSEGNVQSSNLWSRVINDVLPGTGTTPISLGEAYLKLTNAAWVNDSNSVQTRSDNNENAFKNFQAIRAQFPNHASVRLVGIQLKSSSETKDIPTEAIIGTIEFLLDSYGYVPVLLAAPTESERQYANQLNERFNQSLVTVESDFIALPSVLNNLDAVITPDTSIKHLCDLQDIPVVEVSRGASPHFKQWTRNINSIVIAETNDGATISAEQIYLGLEFIFGKITASDLDMPEGIRAYQPVNDSIGALYAPLANTEPTIQTADRLAARCFLMKLSGEGIDPKTASVFSNATRHGLNTWVATQKVLLTDFSREVLGTIRTVYSFAEGKPLANQVLSHLEKLIAFAEVSGPISIAAKLFRAEVENPSKESEESSAQFLERQLFALKNNIQLIIDTVAELESACTASKRTRSQEAIND
jgi:ADP-heptose:LPS heptosyltransferase